MAEGALFVEMMKENAEHVKAYNSSPEFRKMLVGMFMMANNEAHRLGCSLEELEVIDPSMSPDAKTITFKLQKRAAPKKSGILGADGEELLSTLGG